MEWLARLILVVIQRKAFPSSYSSWDLESFRAPQKGLYLKYLTSPKILGRYHCLQQSVVSYASISCA